MKLTQILLEETDRLEKSFHSETWVFQYESGKTTEVSCEETQSIRDQEAKMEGQSRTDFSF